MPPWRFTLRELEAAAFAKQREQWGHTAALRAEIYHSAFGRKGSKSIDKFNPMSRLRRRKRRLNKEEGRAALNKFFRVKDA